LLLLSDVTHALVTKGSNRKDLLLGWFSLIGLCSVWFSIKNNRYNQRHQYQRFFYILSHFLLYLAIYVKEIYPIIKFSGRSKTGTKKVLTGQEGFYIICTDKKRAFHGKVPGYGK
jgi:hypothetical protein